jgi:uncharacterized protein with HEPN domain
MSESSKPHYLRAILYDIGNIKAFIGHYNLAAYSADLKAQYACERAILNISEAVRNLEKHERQSDPDFSLASLSSQIEWANIKGIGNILRHDYEAVTSQRIWSVITRHLDVLERACLEALQKPSP